MSSAVNTELLESAAELIDYFEGTLIQQVLERDLACNDLDALQEHVKEARTQQFNQEYNPDEVATA